MSTDRAARHRALQGERIRSARGERTQRSLAADLRADGCDVTVQTISLWETGQRFPSHRHQLALAAALGVTWSDLFGLDDEEVA